MTNLQHYAGEGDHGSFKPPGQPTNERNGVPGGVDAYQNGNYSDADGTQGEVPTVKLQRIRMLPSSPGKERITVG